MDAMYRVQEAAARAEGASEGSRKGPPASAVST